METVIHVFFALLGLIGGALLVIFLVEFREDAAEHPHYRPAMTPAERLRR